MTASAAHIDRAFAALADPTRRGILERVSRDDASVGELAERFAMTRTGVAKHVRVLEDAELVRTRKEGRIRRVSAGPRSLAEVAAWIDAYRRTVEARFDRLEAVLVRLQRDE